LTKLFEVEAARLIVIKLVVYLIDPEILLKATMGEESTGAVPEKPETEYKAYETQGCGIRRFSTEPLT
jgi:hypothetical protein